MRISPAATGLHYAIQCFEGMKAYKDSTGRLRMFRPDLNMDRFQTSMESLAMPSLDKDNLLACICKLLLIDESWVPAKEGYSIYIRPTAIGMSEHLGVTQSDAIKVFVILSPVGPYFKEGLKPIRLYADTLHVRAWPGGSGKFKLGANYGPTIEPTRLAAEKYGCSQVLFIASCELASLIFHWR